jgi:hypothetical protein
MTSRLVLLLTPAILSVASFIGGAAAVGGPSDIPKGFEKFAPLKPGLYQASLFAPPLRVTIPDASWNGAQWVKGGYDTFDLAWRAHIGDLRMTSASGSTHSVATTLNRLRTERADGPNVGMTLEPTVAVKIAGFSGQQFDGVVTGQYGHTFVPFSGKSGGASSSAGDHDRLPQDAAFRIIVVDVRGKVIFFEIDSGRVSTQDPDLLADAMKIIHPLRFPRP